MASKLSHPRIPSQSSKPTARHMKRQHYLCSDDEDSDSTRRKQHRRVSKACERCRLKKTKCDGEIPCQRCTYDGVACCEGARKKSGSKTVAESCVELLEYQQTKFIAGHLKMYKLMLEAGIWSFGDVRKNSRGVPAVHDILEKLGVMRSSMELSNNFPESPEENRALRRQLEAAKLCSQKPAEEDNENLNRTPSQESPPSLTYTDRESSIDSSHSIISETKLKIEPQSNPVTPLSSMSTTLGFQRQHQTEKPASWNFNPWNGENMSSNSFMPSSFSNYSGNTSSREKPNASLGFSQWGELEINPPILSSSIEAMSEPSTKLESRDLHSSPTNNGGPFTMMPVMDLSGFMCPMEMNMGIPPTVMKYSYDPYMG